MTNRVIKYQKIQNKESLISKIGLGEEWSCLTKCPFGIKKENCDCEKYAKNEYAVMVASGACRNCEWYATNRRKDKDIEYNRETEIVESEFYRCNHPKNTVRKFDLKIEQNS